MLSSVGLLVTFKPELGEMRQRVEKGNFLSAQIQAKIHFAIGLYLCNREREINGISNDVRNKSEFR